MTTTGPKPLRVSDVLRSLTRSFTGPFAFAFSVETSVRIEDARSSSCPGRSFEMYGRRFRSRRTESTGLRSKRRASNPTYARVSPTRTSMRSRRTAFGAAARARFTAARTCGTPPSFAGETTSRCLPTRTVSGFCAALSTASVAPDAAIPPTATPEICTPGAIVAGTGPVDVVPVVVVSVPVGAFPVVVVVVPTEATTLADSPPAARNPSANRTGRRSRRTKRSQALRPVGAARDRLDDDDRAIVAQIAAAEGAAVGDHRRRQLLRRKTPVTLEHRIEPLDAIQLGPPPLFDDAVGVEDERRSRLEPVPYLLVALAGLDAEWQPAPCELDDLAVGVHEPRWRMSRRRARDLALHGVDADVRERDELADRDLARHDVVRGGEEIAGFRVLPGERAEDELRHRHVGRGVDPVPGHVSQHDRKAAVREHEEVVEVTPHVDACGRLVDRADVEPLESRRHARKQR